MRISIEEAKKRRNVPCLYMRYNPKRQCDEVYAPAIDCDWKCDTCGFNPYEAERRFATGYYRKHGVVNTLVFKPRKESANGKA